VVLDESISGMAENDPTVPPEPQKGYSTSDYLAIALTCLAAVMAIILFWLDKTPLSAGISLISVWALMVYPILHFFPKRSVRIIVFSAVVLLSVVFFWRFWPHKDTAAIASGTPGPSSGKPQAAASLAQPGKTNEKPQQQTKVQGNDNNAGNIDQSKSAGSNAAVGEGNFQNSGTISPTVEPCGIAQIGNNNVASVNCAPPSGTDLAKFASGTAIQIVSGGVDPTSVRVPVATGFWVSGKGYIATCLHSVQTGHRLQAEVPMPPLLGNMMTVAAGAMITDLVLIVKDEDSDIAIMHVALSPFERSMHQMAVAQKRDDKGKPIGQPEVTQERYWVPTIASVLPKDGDEIIRVGFNREGTLPVTFYDFGHITRMGVDTSSAKAPYRVFTSFSSVRDLDCGAPIINNAKTVVGMMDGPNGEGIPSTYILRLLEKIP
jgi:hypothetical protein